VSTAKLHIRDAIQRVAPIAAAAALLACLAASPALAQSHDHRGEGGGRGEAHGGGGPNWTRGGGMAPEPRGGPGPGWGHIAPPAGYPGGPPLVGPRGGYAGPGGPAGGPRGGPGWDQQRYNGYWVGGRWYYGAPQVPAYQTPGYRPGFTPWRRGSFLPPSYQSFIVADAERFHLRRPPYGYHWVHVGEEFLLVSSSTGLIFDVVTGE
jgi:Ni/Co efflux regulator RcnB